MTDPALTYYAAAEGVLPPATRDPWTVHGAGGALVSERLRITGTVAANYYTRDYTRAMADDRIEVQGEFQKLTDAPAWDGPGNVLWIDDGERAVGVGLGDSLALIDPATGDVLVTLDADQQPGGITTLRTYHLIKLARSRWELWVDGVLVLTWPYDGGALRSSTTTQIGVGYADPGGTGSGVWDRLETGINAPLVPHPKFDRVRASTAAALQEVWDGEPGTYHGKHTAIWRGVAGLAHATGDRMARIWDSFTADTVRVDSGAFPGDQTPDAVGWTLVGDTGEFDVVRDRVRINGSDSVTYARWDVSNDAALAADARRTWLYGARATFTVVEFTTTDARGRVGPFIVIRDGAFQVGAFLLADRSNPSRFGWMLSDGLPSAPLDNLGDVFHPVDPYQPQTVELFSVGRDRVILFVNGEIVEDVAYSRFVATATTDQDVRIGRDGSAIIDCTADIEGAEAFVAHADLSYRANFQHRVAERLIFASGCERNDRLELWLRHRAGVFSARGTDRVLSEVRRVACDDAAQLVYNRIPAGWVLDLTYPELTPVFLDSTDAVLHVGVEFATDDAPNFTPEQVVALVEKYLVPHATTTSDFTAYPVARLVGASGSGGGGTQFDVGSFNGFAVGDTVEMRGATTDVMVRVTYDSDEGLVDLLANELLDFSGNGRTGELSGANASIQNTAEIGYGMVIPDDPSSGLVEGVRSAAVTPTLSAGFTVTGRFHFGAAHGTAWWVAKSLAGVGVGGYEFYWTGTGDLTGKIYNGASSKTVTYAFSPTADSSFWLGLRWNDATDVLSIWVDGVLVASSTATAFLMTDPASAAVAFGCHESAGTNKWRGRMRDLSLYTRALTDGEMLTLSGDSTGRDALRSDASLHVCYLLSGYSAIAATHDDATPPLAADFVTVASFLGKSWASWELYADGMGNDEIIGTIDLPGLDSHKLADMVAGHTLRYVSSSAAENTWVEAFGIENGTGAAISERVHVVGTTPVTGTKVWAVNGVHGATSSVAAVGNISVQDSTGPTTLYTIPIGARSRGVHLFDPPLLCGPAKVTATADGATTAVMQVWGVEEKLNDTGYNLILAGATPVSTTMTVANDGWDSVRVLAMGYVAAARTVTFAAVFCDPAGALKVDSDSASDTQTMQAFLVSTMGEAAIVDVVLDGTTLVTQSLAAAFPRGRVHHVLGLKLSRAAVGNITVTLDSGAPSDVLVASFAAGDISMGMDIRRIANDSDVGFRLSQVQTTPRWVGVYGTDADGTVVFDIAQLAGVDVVTVPSTITTILGFAMGHVPPTKFVAWSGKAWRYDTASEVFRLLPGVHGWTVQGPLSGDSVTDGILATLDQTDATLATVDMTGTWSATEQSTVLDYDEPTVTVATLTGSYVAGDVMRLTN